MPVLRNSNNKREAQNDESPRFETKKRFECPKTSWEDSADFREHQQEAKSHRGRDQNVSNPFFPRVLLKKLKKCCWQIRQLANQNLSLRRAQWRDAVLVRCKYFNLSVADFAKVRRASLHPRPNPIGPSSETHGQDKIQLARWIFKRRSSPSNSSIISSLQPCPDGFFWNKVKNQPFWSLFSKDSRITEPLASSMYTNSIPESVKDFWKEAQNKDKTFFNALLDDIGTGKFTSLFKENGGYAQLTRNIKRKFSSILIF